MLSTDGLHHQEEIFESFASAYNIKVIKHKKSLNAVSINSKTVIEKYNINVASLQTNTQIIIIYV